MTKRKTKRKQERLHVSTCLSTRFLIRTEGRNERGRNSARATANHPPRIATCELHLRPPAHPRTPGIGSGSSSQPASRAPPSWEEAHAAGAAGGRVEWATSRRRWRRGWPSSRRSRRRTASRPRTAPAPCCG